VNAGAASSELTEPMRADPAIAQVIAALEDVPGCFLIGGAVRDLLLGRAPIDLDVVVEGDAGAAAATAAGRLGGAVVVHERFGTATVSARGLAFDLATARSETYARPGALPDVRSASLDEDLGRRDFTVNALAAALSGDRLGELRAHPRAQEDLHAARLRVLHERSFVDDPTRLLRMVRYAARLAFAPEPRTQELAREAIGGGALATVSGARLGEELRLALREESATGAFSLARALGLEAALHPDLRMDPELAGAALSRLPPDGRRDLVRLAAACRGFERDGLRTWLDGLAFAGEEREVVVAAALDADDLAERLEEARRPSEVGLAARGKPIEQVAMAGALGAGPGAGTWLSELRHVELEVTGDDLLDAGVPEGPAVGAALAAALAARLDGEAAGREAQLAVALRAAGEAAAGG